MYNWKAGGPPLVSKLRVESVKVAMGTELQAKYQKLAQEYAKVIPNNCIDAPFNKSLC